MNILCLGEPMVERARTPEGSERQAFAGDTLNTAVYLKAAAPALTVGYATMLGQDPTSDAMLTQMTAWGLETALVLRHPSRTPGEYTITTDAQGERSFTYDRARSAARAMFQSPGLRLTDLAHCDLLYLSAITLAILPDTDRNTLIAWFQDYRAGGGRLAFDSNYRPALWDSQETAAQAIEATWRQTDIALPSLDDEQALFGDTDAAAVQARLTSWGIQDGALKCGAKGPESLSQMDHTPAFAPAPEVIDSTAAGDSFNGGYLAAKLSGAPEAEALQNGHRIASAVIAQPGAIVDIGAAC